jgi:hypothetical protein
VSSLLDFVNRYYPAHPTADYHRSIEAEAIGLVQEYNSRVDAGKWAIGVVGALVIRGRKAGDGQYTIQNIARTVGVDHKTVYSYADMARFYTIPNVLQFITDLSPTANVAPIWFTGYREVMRHCRVKDAPEGGDTGLDKAMGLLEAVRGLTVAETRLFLNAQARKPAQTTRVVLDQDAEVIHVFPDGRVLLDIGQAALDRLENGKHIRIKATEEVDERIATV